MINLEKFEKNLDKTWFKRLLVSVLIGITTVGYASEYSENVHKEIADNVIRLHVIANSDSVYDQQLKIKVRDRVTEYLGELLESATDIDSAREVINNNLDKISDVAKQGIEYDIKAETGNFNFPTKTYGNTKLPAGNYYALRVIIGEGKGKNWWCVVYPKLCFMELDGDDLKDVLSKEAYLVVTDNERPEYRFKFKILELFKK